MPDSHDYQVSSVRISDISGFEGAGTGNDPCQIRNTDDWNLPADMTKNGYDLHDRHFGLTNSLTVTAI